MLILFACDSSTRQEQSAGASGTERATEQAAIKPAQRILKVAYVNFPPYAYEDDAGRIQGSTIALAKEMFKRAGYIWQPDIYPTKRLVLYLAVGKVDVWVGVKDVRIAPFTITGDVPIKTLSLRAYHIDPTPVLTEFEQLAGRRIIIMRGYRYGDALRDFIEDSDNNEL